MALIFLRTIFFIFIDASSESESSCGVCFVLMFYGLKLKNNHYRSACSMAAYVCTNRDRLAHKFTIWEMNAGTYL